MENMSAVVFQNRLQELAAWEGYGSIRAMCQKYGCDPQVIYNLQKRSSRLLDFLYTICKNEEVEANWLLGVDK